MYIYIYIYIYPSRAPIFGRRRVWHGLEVGAHGVAAPCGRLRPSGDDTTYVEETGRTCTSSATRLIQNIGWRGAYPNAV